MLPSEYKDIERIIRLLKAGYTGTEVGNKFGITRQAISERVRAYYKYSRSKECRTYILVQTCRVCGTEYEFEIKKVLYSEMKFITRLDRPIFYIKPKRPIYICEDCKREHLVICLDCGAIGRAGKEFLPHPTRQRFSYSHYCKECNNGRTKYHYIKNPDSAKRALKKWLSKNPDYMANYHKKRKPELRARGLCTKCSKPNIETDKFAYCQSCRNKALIKFHIRYDKQKQSKIL